MPTGYTAAVVAGEVTEFPAFAMRCARAFGATVTMRDDPLDAAIPDEFSPSDYHLKELRKAAAEVLWLESMRADQAEKAARRAYWARFWFTLNERERYKRENNRLDAMMDAVIEWDPPTSEHVELKRFMVEQLRISRHDISYLTPPKKMSGAEWHALALGEARRLRDYHSREHAKEVERCASRTAWIRRLRSSLKPEAA